MSSRYEFGTNWASFIENHYSAERRQMAAEKLLAFLGDENLSGSASSTSSKSETVLHSLAAFDAKATPATTLLTLIRSRSRQPGSSANWRVSRRIGPSNKATCSTPTVPEARLVESRLFVGSAPSYRRNVAGDRECGAQCGAGRSLLHRPLFIECRPTIRNSGST